MTLTRHCGPYLDETAPPPDSDAENRRRAEFWRARAELMSPEDREKVLAGYAAVYQGGHRMILDFTHHPGSDTDSEEYIATLPYCRIEFVAYSSIAVGKGDRWRQSCLARQGRPTHA